MERSFSHLLRTSRLASFDRKIPQIYATTKKAKAIGDWGMKRNLPTVFKSHFLYIRELDTAEHQTPFDSAAADYLFLQRWKENFPRSRPPTAQPVTVKKDLASLTDEQYKKLLQQAKNRRQEWREALAKNEVRSDDYLEFMNVTKQSKNSSIDSVYSLPSVDSPFSAGRSGPSPDSRTKVGPTYGFFEPSTPTIVQGRTLGRTKSSQLVGVSGVIANLPYTSGPHFQNVSKALQPYYVQSAELEADGYPNVVLSYTPPMGGNWLSPGVISRGDMYAYSTNRSRQTPTGGVAGRKAISRVQGILDAHDKSPTRP
ncbi:hypothetical protein BGW38_004750 [Lunasporangiospora selenospora]|uniref:Uncharacterized protein n=1 Tax=Lunasporangiospora selenospora TaxID=979761 RepID=A0A9P6FPA8_9FUNG|nr:hypothetical protein BGW38_004750 [Lunasporangiospora selenospora]